MTHSFREQFNFFQPSPPCVYLDSAATTQKLDSVLTCVDTFARRQNASVHRSGYPLANRATAEFEKARDKLSALVNANSSDEIVFTSGATEGINMIAQGLHSNMLSGSTILICESEHHANILPWQQLSKRLGLNIRVLPLANSGAFTEVTLAQWLSCISAEVAIIACAQVSNVLGNIYPIRALCEKARQMNALTVIDGTQALAHMPVDVQQLDCDFYVFSGHKMYGPTGIGACWGRFKLLSSLMPSKLGGEMVTEVSFTDFSTAPPPLKFEAGTPNIFGAIGFGQACDFIQQNIVSIEAHENQLYSNLWQELSVISDIVILGNRQRSIGLISFYCPTLDNHAVALHLYQQGIALRYGQHCAMPLLKSLGINACLRVSLGCYTNASDINTFIAALKEALRMANESDHKPALSANVPPASKPAVSGADPSTVLPDDTLRDDEFNDATWEAPIKEAGSWSEKHRQLLHMSKQLPTLAPQFRTIENAVAGCEASVWLDISNCGDGLLAYSDSKVVRGILAVLLLKHAQLQQKEPHKLMRLTPDNVDIAAYSPIVGAVKFDFIAYLKCLGLSDYFSAGRKDGVQAVTERMHKLL
jgi:cysteine desulfurase/selenocysteine lyase